MSSGYRLSTEEQRRYSMGSAHLPPQHGSVSMGQRVAHMPQQQQAMATVAAPQMMMYSQYSPGAAPQQGVISTQQQQQQQQPTFIALDAETGKPIRVMGLQPAGHAPVDAAAAHHLPTQASSPFSSPPLYHQQPAPLQQQHHTFAGAPSLEHQRNQQLALLQQQQQQQALLAQQQQRPQPAQNIPLFMLDPHAPIPDLAASQPMSQSQRSSTSSPPLVQDAYSFSQPQQTVAVINGAPITGSLQQLLAQRQQEQQAQLLAAHQQQRARSMAGQEQQQHPALALNAAQLHRHQMVGMQQLQTHASLANPMYPLKRRRSDCSTPPQLDPNEPKMVVLQNVPAAKPGEFPAVLFCPADEERLTSYQCLLRKQMELFEADPSDIHHSTRQGRTAPIKIGQVGVRCRHCSAPGMAARTKGASYYSQTIEGIYQIAQNMSKVHLCDKCPRIPPDIKHKLNIFRTDCRRAIKGKDYWSEHVLSLGVYECPVDNCLRVNRNGNFKVRVPTSPNENQPNEDDNEESKISEEPEQDDISIEQDTRDNDVVEQGKPNHDDSVEKNNAMHELEQSDSYKREQNAINAVLGVRADPRLSPLPPPEAPEDDAGSDSDTATEDDFDLSTFKRSKQDKVELMGEADEEEEDEEGSAGSLDI